MEGEEMEKAPKTSSLKIFPEEGAEKWGSS